MAGHTLVNGACKKNCNSLEFGSSGSCSPCSGECLTCNAAAVAGCTSCHASYPESSAGVCTLTVGACTSA